MGQFVCGWDGIGERGFIHRNLIALAQLFEDFEVGGAPTFFVEILCHFGAHGGEAGWLQVAARVNAYEMQSVARRNRSAPFARAQCRDLFRKLAAKQCGDFLGFAFCKYESVQE
jgi:hypothetical protein